MKEIVEYGLIGNRPTRQSKLIIDKKEIDRGNKFMAQIQKEMDEINESGEDHVYFNWAMPSLVFNQLASANEQINGVKGEGVTTLNLDGAKEILESKTWNKNMNDVSPWAGNHFDGKNKII